MSKGPFEIRLLGSKVLGPDPARDPMLGGHIRLTINGIVVADDDEYGLERSALGLMRSVERDHNVLERVGFPTLLIHDCGFPWDACSNFFTDWSVSHENDEVVIGEVRSVDSHPMFRELTFPDASCRMALSDYRDPILAFAAAVRDAYFADGDKIIEEVEERPFYDAFWTEYRALLSRT